MEEIKTQKRAVHVLSEDVARKIAAGEVIDRPASIVREMLDNAVDSGANKIRLEIFGGGIEKIRVSDNGCGMSKEDLLTCARPHATSKISTENDLLTLDTLGFRGEALSSMAAVSRLELRSGLWKLNVSSTEDHILTQSSPVKGTIVQTEGLFENFPARRIFLKRASSEALLCHSMFVEKALPKPDINFVFATDGEEKCNLFANQTLTERFVQGMDFSENEKLFFELENKSEDSKWSFRLIIGEPSVTRQNRKHIFIYVNGRRVQEYSLLQAIEYGCEGYFPNGLHPATALFVDIDPALVDFNIHPAKREVRFKDSSRLHHGISSTVKNFFKQYTVKTMVKALDSLDSEFDDFKTNSTFVKSPIPPSKTPTYSPTHSSTYSLNHQNYFEKRQDRRTSFFSPSEKEFDGEFKNPISKPNYIPQAKDEISDVPGFHFVGSAMGTFLIAERNDTLYIIDQHAAHERYLFDQILEASGQKQTLLVPYTIQTQSESDDKYIEAIQEKLESAGFTCKSCGNGKWEFSTVPITWKGKEKDLANDILDRRLNPSDIMRATATSTACRTAVKDGDVLDEKTAAWIASRAFVLPDPHCPHGRPVFTTITRKQLFALVKRT